MKKLFSLLFIFLTVSAALSQNVPCYSIIIEKVTLCSSPYKWRSIKIIAPKQKLLNFLRTSKVVHNCNYLLQSEEQLAEKFRPEDCAGDNVRIELDDPKDIIQLYKEVKMHEPNGSAQVCLSSDGMVSISVSVGDTSFEINSKGKFAFSAKGKDGIERKVEL